LEARIRRTLRRMRGERVRGRAGHGGVMMIVLLLFLQKQNLCAACPAHSEAPPRSDARSDCVCSLGFSGPAGGPCAECPANAYAEALNMSACTACLANSEAPAGATRRGLSVQPRLLRCAGRALRRVRGERVRGRAGHGGVLRLSGELAGARAQRRANGLCLPPRLLRRSRRELKWKVFSS
jgi:hypothetical protein